MILSCLIPLQQAFFSGAHGLTGTGKCQQNRAIVSSFLCVNDNEWLPNGIITLHE
jgi:hypothetical protein